MFLCVMEDEYVRDTVQGTKSHSNIKKRNSYKKISVIFSRTLIYNPQTSSKLSLNLSFPIPQALVRSFLDLRPYLQSRLVPILFLSF